MPFAAPLCCTFLLHFFRPVLGFLGTFSAFFWNFFCNFLHFFSPPKKWFYAHLEYDFFRRTFYVVLNRELEPEKAVLIRIVTVEKAYLFVQIVVMSVLPIGKVVKKLFQFGLPGYLGHFLIKLLRFKFKFNSN